MGVIGPEMLHLIHTVFLKYKTAFEKDSTSVILLDLKPHSLEYIHSCFVLKNSVAALWQNFINDPCLETSTVNKLRSMGFVLELLRT